MKYRGTRFLIWRNTSILLDFSLNYVIFIHQVDWVTEVMALQWKTTIFFRARWYYYICQSPIPARSRNYKFLNLGFLDWEKGSRIVIHNHNNVNVIFPLSHSLSLPFILINQTFEFFAEYPLVLKNFCLTRQHSFLNAIMFKFLLHRLKTQKRHIITKVWWN